jgi:hypothetical protein
VLQDKLRRQGDEIQLFGLGSFQQPLHQARLGAGVGINAQDPLRGGIRLEKSIVQRPRATDPAAGQGIVGNEAKAGIPRGHLQHFFAGAILGAAIHHQNFAHNGSLAVQPFQTGIQALGLVEGGQQDADQARREGDPRLARGQRGRAPQRGQQPRQQHRRHRHLQGQQTQGSRIPQPIRDPVRIH